MGSRSGKRDLSFGCAAPGNRRHAAAETHHLCTNRGLLSAGTGNPGKNPVPMAVLPLLSRKKNYVRVLLESFGSIEQLDYTIAGIGIQVNADEDELPDGMTSLLLVAQREQDRKQLAAAVLNQLDIIYHQFCQGQFGSVFSSIGTIIVSNPCRKGIGSMQALRKITPYRQWSGTLEKPSVYE